MQGAGMPGATHLASSFAEKHFRVLVGTKLIMSQQCALAAKKLEGDILLLYQAVMKPQLQCWFWSCHYKADMDLRRQSNEGSQKWQWYSSIFHMKKEREFWGYLTYRRLSEGVSSRYTSTWRADTKKTEPNSFQWCPISGWEEMGTNWNRIRTSWNTFLLWMWWNTRTDCPETLWSLHPWRYSQAVWTWAWGNSSGWPYLGMESHKLMIRSHLKVPVNFKHFVILWFSESTVSVNTRSRNLGDAAALSYPR